MARPKRMYRLVDSKGRIYLPKEIRKEAGIECGDIIRLEADNGGWIGIMKVALIETGDQSPEAVEAFVHAAIRQMPDETRIRLLTELAGLMQKEES